MNKKTLGIIGGFAALGVGALGLTIKRVKDSMTEEGLEKTRSKFDGYFEVQNEEE